jgi:S-adenosylmethionine hydrolase
MFVAPDNGVLSYALREIGSFQAFELANEAFRLAGTSNTFHGRDIFAPAAAQLAAGVPLEQFGVQVEQPVKLPEPLLAVDGGRITGEVLHIDHFGTAVTSIGRFEWAEQDLRLQPRFGSLPALTLSAADATAVTNRQLFARIRRTYAEVGQGDALALVGSSGYLELSINGGNFAERYGVKIGDTVELQQKEMG